VTSDADRRTLLSLARRAIAAAVRREAPPSHDAPATLARSAGAFVTLHARGELRGCIGHVEADRALADVVASCAVSAAEHDPRFPPVGEAELDIIDIEVSVLGPLERVHALTDIEVGRHGLVVENGWHRGLLLPQVAPEWGWDAAAFVAHTCRKAGLAPDAWPHRGAVLYRFEAEVFGEEPRRT
jgi:AmmeMemoRadiSam system protein A